MEQIDINNIEEYSSFIKNNPGAVVYFSTPECNVCKVLKPKLKELLAEEFPEMKFAYVDLHKAQELAAQNRIFAVPTILFFFEGKELFRKSRNVNLTILMEELSRPYSLFFD